MGVVAGIKGNHLPGGLVKVHHQPCLLVHGSHVARADVTPTQLDPGGVRAPGALAVHQGIGDRLAADAALAGPLGCVEGELDVTGD